MEFADGVIIIAKGKKEAEDTKEAFKLLENFGLRMNVAKMQIISDHKELVDLTHLGGIQIKENLNYLGIEIFCNRKKTLDAAKNKVKKYVNYLKGRLTSNLQEVSQLLFAFFYRSLLIYYLMPLFAAGAITEPEVEKMEIQMMRDHFYLKGDIKSIDIAKIICFFTNTTASIVAK